MRCGGPGLCSECSADAARARAALAQPSPASGLDPLDLAPHAEAFNEAPDEALKPDQAEAERPEVVARVVHSNPVVLGQCGPLNANDELMTVAQHAASVARWAEMFNRVEQQRDAALVEVERLRESKGDPVGSLEKCMKVMYERDEHAKRLEAALARVAELAQALRHLLHNIKASGKRIDLGLAKECAEDALARIDSTVAAQAQHSVPGDIMRDAQRYRWLRDQQFYFSFSTENSDAGISSCTAGMSSRFKNLSWVDAAIDSAIAAAPGNSVPQAWLDVQAERRRQITAEGWTPEHDDLYCAAELPRAAAAYILNGANDEAPAIWPFVAKWWKPRDSRSNYVRAGALILAEIERLDRAAPGKEVGHE